MPASEALQKRLQEFIQLCEKQDYFRGQTLRIGEPIHSGTSNQCWIVWSAEKKYLARFSHELPENLFTDWQKEIKVNQFAAQVGLSAEVIFADPASLAAIYPWSGESLDSQNLPDLVLQEFGGKLGQLHATNAPARAIGYRQTIECYLRLFHDNTEYESAVPDYDALLELADEWDQSEEKCFCHHDLHPGNILWNGENITLIDWEYARLAHPLFDLASVSYYLELSDNQLALLLQNYPGSPYSSKQIRAAEQMVVGLDELWHMATKSALKNC